ncbi:MAG: hypothetical protein Q7S69_07430 [Nitrosomonadaceae bacterium]|nr:hypothetical protein [Nitrosomonadaceae bacterium]
MTNKLQNQAIANQLVAAHNLPKLATVKTLPNCFPLLGLTAAAIHGHISNLKTASTAKAARLQATDWARLALSFAVAVKS